jgi:hypothetical protein
MTQEHFIFLAQNEINFETTKLGFIRNLSPELLDQYANIYRAYIDPHYVITPWCSSCVMAMMERLMRIYEAYKLTQAQTKIETEVIKETAKRTRKK